MLLCRDQILCGKKNTICYRNWRLQSHYTPRCFINSWDHFDHCPSAWARAQASRSRGQAQCPLARPPKWPLEAWGAHSSLVPPSSAPSHCMPSWWAGQSTVPSLQVLGSPRWIHMYPSPSSSFWREEEGESPTTTIKVIHWQDDQSLTLKDVTHGLSQFHCLLLKRTILKSLKFLKELSSFTKTWPYASSRPFASNARTIETATESEWQKQNNTSLCAIAFAEQRAEFRGKNTTVLLTHRDNIKHIGQGWTIL